MEGQSAPPLTPKTYRFADVDEFRSSVRQLSVTFTPLVRKISAEQTILNLPGCDVNYTKSFPRIIDAQLRPDCTAIAFNMDDGVPVRFNGVEEVMPAIAIGTGGSTYTQVEKGPRSYTSIIFSPTIENRGWFEPGPSWRFYVISKAMQLRLRNLVLEVLAAANNSCRRDRTQLRTTHNRRSSPLAPPCDPRRPCRSRQAIHASSLRRSSASSPTRSCATGISR